MLSSLTHWSLDHDFWWVNLIQSFEAIWIFNHVVFSKHAKKKNDASVVQLSEVGLIGANIPGLRILSKPSITLIQTLSKYGAIYTNDSLLSAGQQHCYCGIPT